jgi:hypothetical protein
MASEASPEKPAEEAGQPGPWLRAALVCERIILEADGTPTLVRVIDRVYGTRMTFGPTGHLADAPADAAVSEATLPLQMFLFISWMTGPVQVERDVEIRLERPDGSRVTLFSDHITFEGGYLALNIHLGMFLDAESKGLFIADVLVSGQLQTRIPFVAADQPTPS